MRHLLFISTTLRPDSGYGSLTRNHCDAFYDKGVPFTLLLPHTAERAIVPYATQVRYVLPNLPLNFGALPDLPKLRHFYASVRWECAASTLMHSLLDFPYAALGFRMARTRRIPFFFSALGTYSVAPFGRRIDRALFMPAYRGARRIFAISDFTAEAMQAAAGEERHIDTVRLPAPPPTPSVSRSFSWLPSSARVILSVGPLKERKGMDVLVRAMPAIVRLLPDAHLVIAAAYGDERPYRALAEEGGVAGNVHIVRNPSADELGALFARADLFSMTPRSVDSEFEGYGLVYGEAGWYRLPVVASRSGGVPEAVLDGETGILVPENDPCVTAQAIISVLRDERLARRLGDAGYAHASRRTTARYAEELLALYEAPYQP